MEATSYTASTGDDEDDAEADAATDADADDSFFPLRS